MCLSSGCTERKKTPKQNKGEFGEHWPFLNSLWPGGVGLEFGPPPSCTCLVPLLRRWFEAQRLSAGKDGRLGAC